MAAFPIWILAETRASGSDNGTFLDLGRRNLRRLEDRSGTWRPPACEVSNERSPAGSMIILSVRTRSALSSAIDRAREAPDR